MKGRSASDRNQVGTLDFVARALVSLIFIVSGISKILNWGGALQYMQSLGMPLATFFLVLATAVELLGGLSIFFGLQARAGALLLLLYLVPVTLVFHAYWNLEGMERQLQMAHFLKNLAIMGGLLRIAAHGAGAMSIDASSYRRGISGQEYGGPGTGKAA